jgi:hypothetical protein
LLVLAGRNIVDAEDVPRPAPETPDEAPPFQKSHMTLRTGGAIPEGEGHGSGNYDTPN